jgi:hypothetical protein
MTTLVQQTVWRVQPFSVGWAFAELHMPAVRKALGDLPSKIFFDIETAPAKKDMENATDLILSLSSGDIAVRVRKRHYWDLQNEKGWKHDWSVRAESRGHKTEIHKLREGFGRWYFMGYSDDDNGKLIGWWLIDLDKVRSLDILEEDWPIYPNMDGTSGMYIPISELTRLDCIAACSI